MDSASSASKGKKIIFLVTTTIIAIMYFITGLGNLLPVAHIAKDMAHLGYPAYFLKIIGTWKILAAIVVVIPNFQRLKEWAYAGMILDLTGAALSRYFTGDARSTIVIPLGISILITVNYLIRHSLQNQK
jgi:uncharacterized membrane protein YphA (DoxX/SURF4 family)